MSVLLNSDSGLGFWIGLTNNILEQSLHLDCSIGLFHGYFLYICTIILAKLKSSDFCIWKSLFSIAVCVTPQEFCFLKYFICKLVLVCNVCLWAKFLKGASIKSVLPLLNWYKYLINTEAEENNEWCYSEYTLNTSKAAKYTVWYRICGLISAQSSHISELMTELA